jgi:hypothetical protein
MRAKDRIKTESTTSRNIATGGGRRRTTGIERSYESAMRALLKSMSSFGTTSNTTPRAGIVRGVRIHH